ncbi:unnamed protein product [Allacma fusca]|uniref:SEC14-like protein 2 n=1 Tax=Allacma fusca TaxID=39272 RepID=A0A8J2J4C7_9HEXA|nr:unnamed protein product [Allacma fusca]
MTTDTPSTQCSEGGKSFQGNYLQHVATDKITAAEEANLKLLRDRIDDIPLNWFFAHERNLVRWLRAREGNVEQAEAMLRKNMEWRKEEGLDTILKRCVPDFMLREFPFQITGFDKDGDIVAVIPYGQWDFRSLVEKGQKMEFVNYINYIIEFAYKFLQSRSSLETIYNKVILILDLQGFSISQVLSKPTIQMLLEMLQSLEDNHPECLKRAFLINAAKVFELLWAIAKPLMTTRTLSKVDILGYNANIWKLKMLTMIAAENLPTQYGGGNTTCPKIGYYIEKIANIDPTRDFKLRLHENRTYNEDDMDIITVPAWNKFETQREVPGKGYILRWAFTTEDYDIGFSMMNEDGEKIVKVQKADSHKHRQLGTYVCPAAGEYTFCFDNTYCRFWAKTLRFIIQVCDPDDDLENSRPIQDESESEDSLHSQGED